MKITILNTSILSNDGSLSDSSGLNIGVVGHIIEEFTMSDLNQELTLEPRKITKEDLYELSKKTVYVAMTNSDPEKDDFRTVIPIEIEGKLLIIKTLINGQ